MSGPAHNFTPATRAEKWSSRLTQVAIVLVMLALW